MKHNFGGSYLKGYRVLLLFLVANLISNLISRPSIRTFEIFVILTANMSLLGIFESMIFLFTM